MVDTAHGRSATLAGPVDLSVGDVRLSLTAEPARALADLRGPELGHYTPAAGIPELRSAVAQRQASDGWQPDPDQVVVTPGARLAIFLALRAVLEPGDEVLLPTPGWGTYHELVRLAGGVPVRLPASPRGKVGPDLLETARTARTRMVVLNSPINPTGAVYDPDEAAAVVAWAAAAGAWALLDELYGDLTLEGPPRLLGSRLDEEARDHCLMIGGMTKGYAMAGWRVGWLVAPASVAQRASSLAGTLAAHPANVSQRVALDALAGDLPGRLRETLRENRDRLLGALERVGDVSVATPEAGLFAFPDVSSCVERLGLTSSAALAERLERAGVRVLPGERFGAPGHLRLSFAVDPALLERAASTLVDALA